MAKIIKSADELEQPDVDDIAPGAPPDVGPEPPDIPESDLDLEDGDAE